MEARLLCAALAALALLFCGAGRGPASVRSPHFIVTAPSQDLATQVCQAAETYRRDLAIEWLGHELPEWHDICPITVQLDPGAGGATSFVFQGGVPTQWTMRIQGTPERILDSVLPHEITHTIFATHFGGPLPRWADEGACTTVEHVSEKAKQDRLLIQFLTGDSQGNTRSIPFNKMFAMRNYPRDILPLYSQGYSLTRYLIQQGGKRKFVAYVGEGLQSNNWPAVTRKFYGYADLSELQVTWLAWVQQGSPNLPDTASLASASQPAAPQPRTQMETLLQQPQSRIPDGALVSWQTPQAQNARALAKADRYSAPTIATNLTAPDQPLQQAGVSSVSRPVTDGFYARRRDQAQAVQQAAPTAGQTSLQSASYQGSETQRIASPPPSPNSRKVLLEWTRPPQDQIARYDESPAPMFR